MSVKAQENPWIDPRYVQISKKEAASICGMSTSELDRRRISDPDCPVGFKKTQTKKSPVHFRLADIYEYSEKLIKRAMAHSE